MRIEPFRGSVEVAAGRLTPGRLRGPGYRRLFPDVYVPVVPGADPPDLALRARAAYLLVEGRGALAGWAAAEVLGASCGPAGAAVEVIVPEGKQRRHPDLRVRRARVYRDEVTAIDGMAVTTARRTAFDLACALPVREAVVAVDALARVGEFDPEELHEVRSRHLGARGSARLPEVIRRADRSAGSPMETRIRLAITDAGLPCPVLQHRVGPYLLDLAFVPQRVGVEHNGSDHLKPERAVRDLAREAFLARAGWRVLRFDAATVLRRPHIVAARVRRELDRAQTSGTGAFLSTPGGDFGSDHRGR